MTDKELIEQLAKEIKALPRFNFLLNEAGGVKRWENSSGDWIERYEVVTMIDNAIEAYQAASDEKVVAESEQQQAVAWQRYIDAENKWIDVAFEDIRHYKDKGQSIRELFTSPPKQAIPEGYALININELNKIVGEMQGNDCFSEEVLSAVLDYIDMKTAPTNTEVGSETKA